MALPESGFPKPQAVKRRVHPQVTGQPRIASIIHVEPYIKLAGSIDDFTEIGADQ
jgi:hypothetical protein